MAPAVHGPANPAAAARSGVPFPRRRTAPARRAFCARPASAFSPPSGA